MAYSIERHSEVHAHDVMAAGVFILNEYQRSFRNLEISEACIVVVLVQEELGPLMDLLYVDKEYEFLQEEEGSA